MIRAGFFVYIENCLRLYLLNVFGIKVERIVFEEAEQLQACWLESKPRLEKSEAFERWGPILPVGLHGVLLVDGEKVNLKRPFNVLVQMTANCL